MKSRSFSPAVDSLEGRALLSGVSTSQLAKIDLAFNVASATLLYNSQQIASGLASNTTLQADKAAVLADKNEIFLAFVNFAHYNTDVNLPVLSNLLFYSPTVTGADLVKDGFINSTVPGEPALLADEATLATATQSATQTLTAKFSDEAAINTLATSVQSIAPSTDAAIRTAITGAPSSSSILVPTGTPSAGSLANEILVQHTSRLIAIPTAELNYFKAAVTNK